MPGLGFASCAQALYPPLILELPIPLNLAFLIVFPPWGLVVPQLPALNEAGCCLSLSNRLSDKTGCQPHWFQVVSPLPCSHGWQAATASHRDGLAHPRGLSDPGGPTVCNSSDSTSPFLPGGRAGIFLGCNFFHLPVAA